MPSKLQAYAQMADHTATQITGSHKRWTDFLTTAARLYKYPYNEQLMIYAQRPEATACAEYDFWNERMGRYVRRGSKGIALIDNSGDRPRLKYVFDVADTGGRDNSRNLRLWELREEHGDAVSAMLERNYDIPETDGLADQLEKVAAQLADEYWNEHRRDILYIVDDSYLEDYDDFNVGVAFRNAATVSITYSLMSRCGLHPEEYFEHEDFLSIFDWNTPSAVAALGTAVSEINQQVLRQIEVTIRNYERERSYDNERTDLHQERGLPDTRPDALGAAGGKPRQVREAAEEVPSGASPGAVEQPDTLGEVVPAPAGDRADGAEPIGADDAGAGESGGGDGEPESVRPDEVGGPDEHLQGASGGDNSERADIQLTPPNPVQLSFFPSENEQIAYIDQAESVPTTPFAFSFAQEDIDHVLRLGGNNDHSRMRVASEYMKQKPMEDIAAFLSREYQGGGGFVTDNGRFSAWYAGDGIHLAKGDAARYVNSAQVIPWADAAARIGALLEQGHFATNVELAETDGYIRSQLAQSLWYLYHDFDEPAKEQGLLPSMEPLDSGGYPEITEKLAAALAQPEFLSALTAEYEQFSEAYREDRSLLRFHYHRTGELLDRLRDLALPRREYITDMAEPPQTGRFITEDEINGALTHGSSFEGGKSRIYAYFTEKHTPKEQATFLKEEYGWGGHNNALPGSFHSQEDHDRKGIRLKKPDCADIEMSWSNVAKRISELVWRDRYFTPEEKARFEQRQRERREQQAQATEAAQPPQPEKASAPSVREEYIAEILRYEVSPNATTAQISAFFQSHPEESARINYLKLHFGNVYTMFNAADGQQIGFHGSPEHLEVWEGNYLTATANTKLPWPEVCARMEAVLEPEAISARLEELKTHSNFTDLIATYEELFDVPSDECITSWFGDYHLWEIEHGTPDEKIVEAFDKALAALGISQDEYFANENYTYRGNIVMDMCAWNALPVPQYILDQMPDASGVKRPTIRELYEQYKPMVLAAVNEDSAYRNACGNSDRENAYLEGNAAIRRAVLAADDTQLTRLYFDVTEFHNRLHQEVLDETYPRLHEYLRPITQDDIDNALRAWNGDADSKRAVVRYMADHARDKDTAVWLCREYGGSDTRSLFITRSGTDETVELSWPKVQRRIAQLIQEDRFLEDWEKTVEARDYSSEYRLLDRLRADCEYFLGAGQRSEKNLWAGDVRAQIAKMRELYNTLPEKPEWLTEEAINSYAERMSPKYQVAVYHHFENGFDDKLDYQTLQEAEKTAQGYVDGTMEPDGFAYDGAAVYDLQERRFLRIFGDFPDENAHAQVRAAAEQAAPEISPVEDDYDIDEILDEYPTSVEIDGEWRTFPNAEAAEEALHQAAVFPFAVGDTVYLEDGKAFIVEEISDMHIQLRDPTLFYPIWRSESRESFDRLMQRYPQPDKPETEVKEAPRPEYTSETVAVYPAEQNNLPYDIVIQTLHTEPEHDPPAQEQPEINPPPENFRITDDALGTGGAKAKFRMNMDAINLLKELEFDGRQATPDEQEVLSKYVGWGGLADAFDETKDNWKNEFVELYAALSPEEYAAARASTLNAHYTSPTVIRAIYEAVGNMGFQTGNILEPSMGVGNFFGLLPQEMSTSKLYGVELDSITGRIAKQLYPAADITVAGFETTDRRDFFDLAIGNVPFGQYQVNDRAYNKLGFSIHDYFFAKTLDQVRPGGVIAFVSSRYTMDKQSPEVRKYIAQRAELLGAIRLPNNAFKANAGTDVVSDIIFLQKRDRPIDIEPDWVHLGQNADGFAINSYFIDNPEMVLGQQTSESTQYGRQDFTVEPIPGADLAEQLHEAVQHISGQYTEAELPELGEGEAIDASIPADPNVKNYSYTIVDGEVYYRENSRMVKPELNATAIERVKGMVELRDCVQTLIGQQLDGFISDTAIRRTQAELNALYDDFTAKYGLINSRGNSLAFADDSSYYLLCSLEVIDENGNLERKADMFTRRTIKPHEAVTSVDTASEALALSISEKACVDMEYMAQLTGKTHDELVSELTGVIFCDPLEASKENPAAGWHTADDYLSGNVREKLRIARSYAAPGFPRDGLPDFSANVAALEQAQPKDLDASEIEVRLGATWIGKEYIQEFMEDLLEPPFYMRRNIQVNFAEFTGEWNITGKNMTGYRDINARMTYGTERANAYKILEDTLNLRDVRIYDTVTDPDGRERRVLNSKETTLAQQKQQAIKDAFRDWIWKDPDRRQELVQKYNELFNSTRPREYDGKHITFSGINPEIQLREHQLNAVAHILYGGNTLLAHEVGAGKTFEMVAAAMESKRLGLCQKAMFAVPNHLTEQWASEFLRLYPSANILVATKKDFETRNRKKFCARIATGDYDAIIMGHSQFERIPVSKERQERLLQEQIWEIEDGIRELRGSNAERFTIKQLERTKKSLEARLEKLMDSERKDDVVTFEQLGVDRLYVDEAHSFKNLFLYTKMRNVAGLSTSDAQKSSDMLLKCRYIDEITGSRGVVFATGTPVSNSMTELFTMQRYLQHDTIKRQGLAHFDSWASTFGETTTAIELAPEGTGYRARTRFAKFFNLPELMTLFKEVADIKTADQLNLPTPTPVYHNEVAQPTAIQKELVQELSERAAEVHAGRVEPNIDNMLKITSDGRKLGLDQRVINPDLPDDPNSKVNMCVENITKIWRDGQADKLTQLVFCDLSTPKATPTKKAAKAAAGNLDSPELHALEQLTPDAAPEPPFSIYDDIREKLVAKGIPREQVAFIHEANTEVRKKELFAKVRSGQVRVLMGSTFKMGAGMNVQDRLVALHDLDCPWRPGDLEQRSGRIIRQGNKNKEVHIYRYVTEGTFDAYLWQTVENKQKFISQIMTSKSPVRSCEDIDETALSYAEIKALCAGDERIKEKMDLDVDVSRLKLMKANHQSQQYRLEDNILRYFPEQIEQKKGFIAGLEADMATLSAHPHPTDGFAGMEVKGDRLTDKDNAGAAILEAFKDAKGLEPVPIGNYRGFSMSLTVEDFGKEFILTLKGQMTHRVTLGKDARGNLTRIDNALAAMPERLQNVRDGLENLYAQMAAAQAELGKPFPQETELREKSARLAELNAELNIDDRTPMERLAEPDIAKSARPSVLEKLKAPCVPGRQDKHKSHELEDR